MDQYKTPEAGKRLTRVILIAATLGRPIAVTPGIPPDRLKLLREAYLKTLKDPELIAETKRQRWDIDPLTGEEMEQLAKEVMSPTERSHRTDEVGARELIDENSFKSSKVQAFKVLGLIFFCPLNF